MSKEQGNKGGTIFVCKEAPAGGLSKGQNRRQGAAMRLAICSAVGVLAAMTAGETDGWLDFSARARALYVDPDDDIDDDIEDDIEDDVEDSVEDSIEDDVEQSIEAALSDDLDDDIDDKIGTIIDDELDDDLDDDIDDDEDGEDEFDDDDDNDDDDDDDDDDDEDDSRDAMDSADLGRLLNILRTEDGDEFVSDEGVVLLSPEELSSFDRAGFEVLERRRLSALGLVAVTIALRPGSDIAAERRRLATAAPNAVLDRNGVYRSQAVPAAKVQFLTSEFFKDAPGISAKAGAMNGRIGLIDTQVDQDHPSLKRKSIKHAEFAGEKPPAAHGTAVASIIVGEHDTFRGLLPQAKLYAASVFVRTREGADAATSLALIKALDWMAERKVSIVNMSLAGPPNEALRAAIDRVAARGMLVVAAAGNDGPAAPPRYPAAYGSVVAVTAIDAGERVFRMAGRGDHLEFSAPGVGVLNADADTGGFAALSGTSIAAPFVTAVIALECARARDCGESVRALRDGAKDLGAPGRDVVYGYGLVRPRR